MVQVALPVGLDSELTYSLPPALAERARVGSRVVVPLGSRREIGIITALDVVPEVERKWKDVLNVPDSAPAIPPALFDSLRWMSEYYVAPLGLCLRSALPASLASAATPVPSPKTEAVAHVDGDPMSLMQRDTLFRRSPRQRDVYGLIEELGGRASVRHLVDQLNVSVGVVHALRDRGLIRIEQVVRVRDPFASRDAAVTERHKPTPAQAGAIEQLVGLAPGKVALLHGVTGSGKTLVYLEVLRRLMDEPRNTAIVLVPEIALTPQTVSRFRAVFGDQVAVLHSALSDGERLDAWRALRSGDRRIAVGARSAVFAPLQHVRVIIVDEEHEGSYKQGENPRYHARDLAMVRAQHEGAVVVLGSATPSLESWSHAQEGRYELIALPDRVGGGVLPTVQVVDPSGGFPSAASPPPVGEDTHATSRPRQPTATDDVAARATDPHARVPAPPQRPTTIRDPFRRVVSEPLELALRDTVGRGEQAILLLNRRGYSAFLQCSSCSEVVACPDCSISLTWHRTPERLACHYCGHTEPLVTTCRKCQEPNVRQRGLGTQQVERLLSEKLPHLRVVRMDVDTTTGKWAHAEILARVEQKEVDVLLGTQMIAKGLDFPNVTLVGVIDADIGMNLPDFRAAERTFQLLAQVAGRAGRSTKAGHVIIQTRMASHHAINCALTHDYAAFAEQELAHRQSPPYPPTVRLTNIIVSGSDEPTVAEEAKRAAEWCTRVITRRGIPDLTVIGPAKCAIERIKQRWRWHLLLRGGTPAAQSALLQYFARRFLPTSHQRKGLRIVIDRDPVSLL